MSEPRAARTGTATHMHYTMTVETYKNLCLVRDELQLFAAVAARRAAENPEVVICRNMLAHCFDYLAQRVEQAVNLIGDDEAAETPPTSFEEHTHKN